MKAAIASVTFLATELVTVLNRLSAISSQAVSPVVKMLVLTFAAYSSLEFWSRVNAVGRVMFPARILSRAYRWDK